MSNVNHAVNLSLNPLNMPKDDTDYPIGSLRSNKKLSRSETFIRLLAFGSYFVHVLSKFSSFVILASEFLSFLEVSS